MSTEVPTTAAQAVASNQTGAALSALTAAVQELQNQLDETDQRKSELNERRSSLYSAPLNAADIQQCVSELIDLRASQYLSWMRDQDIASKIATPHRGVGLGKSPLTLEDMEAMLGNVTSSNKETLALQGGWALPLFEMSGVFETSWPYFLLGDLLKEKLIKAIAVLQPDQTPGTAGAGFPSADERRKEIKTIDAELRQLDQEAGRLRNEIAKLCAPVLASAKALSSAGRV